MKTKKSYRKDLESKRNIFLLIGVVVAFSFALIAFEWTTDKILVDLIPITVDGIDGIELPPVIIEKPEEVELEKPKPAIPEILVFTDDPTCDDPNFGLLDPEDYQPPVFEPLSLYDEERVDDIVFDYVDKMPEFKGGDAALMRFLANEIRYPTVPQEMNISGKVYVRFVIDKEGYVTDVTLVRGVDQYLDKEAIRVVSSMPRWNPGLNRNVPVKVAFTIPIKFVLK